MENANYDNKKSLCLSLGFFDCMHLGHRKIVDAAKNYCKETGAENGIFTFTDDISVSVKNGDKQLYTFSERKILYAQCGIDRVVAYPFNERIKNTGKREFLDMLLSAYNITAFACGEDYTFGRGGEGNVEYLKNYCEEKQLKLIVVPIVKSEGEKISSSGIKKLIGSGQMEKADLFLGQPYFIDNKIVSGRGQGHLFGIPTANVMVPEDKFLPVKGVYACRMVIDGKSYLAVTNVGEKPTFDDYTTSVEALIDGFSGNLYGKNVRLFFLKYLRGIQKFDNPYTLAETIRNDLNRSKKLC